MPSLAFGLSSYERLEGNMPGLPVENMYVEEAPSEEKGLVLQSRPALVDRALDMGSQAVNALYQVDGVLSGNLFGIAGDSLYSETTLLGTLGSSGVASLAGYENLLFANAGAGVYSWNGTTFASVAFPDGADVLRLLVGASRLIAIRRDTETYYWSDPLSGTIDGLSFASAESNPDRLRDMLFLDDTLILFGAGTVEFHANTNDADLPFAPIEGRVFERGIKATGCACQFGASFAWVTDRNQVCVGGPDTIVSNAGLEAQIAASGECRLFSFFIGGEEFLALRLEGETQVFGARSGRWSKFTTAGGNWAAQCFANGVFGSANDGKTLAFSEGKLELGGTLERLFRAGLVLNGGGVMMDNLSLRANPGQTTYTVGTYAAPSVEMRLSRDGGQTWGAWKRKSLGAQGAYRKKVQWRGLGMASAPGFLAEFRCTDPVPFRVSDVLANEPLGGR